MSALLPVHERVGHLFVNAAHDAKPNERVIVDSTAGAFPITLATNPSPGQTFELSESPGVAMLSTNAVTLSCVAPRTILGSGQSWILNTDDPHLKLAYDPGADNWEAVRTAPAATATAAGGSPYIHVAANYTAKAYDLIVVDTTTGQKTITLPAAPADGEYVEIVEATATANFATSRVNVAGGANTVDGLATGRLGEDGVWARFVFNAVTSDWERTHTAPAPTSWTTSSSVISVLRHTAPVTQTFSLAAIPAAALADVVALQFRVWPRGGSGGTFNGIIQLDIRPTAGENGSQIWQNQYAPGVANQNNWWSFNTTFRRAKTSPNFAMQYAISEVSSGVQAFDMSVQVTIKGHS